MAGTFCPNEVSDSTDKAPSRTLLGTIHAMSPSARGRCCVGCPAINNKTRKPPFAVWPIRVPTLTDLLLFLVQPSHEMNF